jgi:formylglycine-generating enzyme required for sulfatase activity
VGITILAGLLLARDAPSQAEPDPTPVTIINSLGMRLVLVPAGNFMMGAEEEMADIQRAFPYMNPVVLPRERPRHRVRITKPFYMGAYEVTLGQFLSFVKDSNYRVDAEDGRPMTGYGPKGERITSTTFRPWAPGWPIGEDHPAGYVSWNDATAFCRWLSKKEGRKYRLPTEAEWEYACRAGTNTRYSSGNDPEDLVRYANTADADRAALFPDARASTYDGEGRKNGTVPFPFLKGHDGFGWTAPVGKFRPNTFGLYDMHGNSWEWCSDWLGEDYYKTSPADDPEGPRTGTIRVSRGGGFDNTPDMLRSARRDGGTPESHDCHDGFRVVCER